MLKIRWLAALIVVCSLALSANGDDPKAKKRLLLVTDSGGFIHDSVGLAEQTLKKIGPDYGFEVECFRFTRDPENAKVFDEYAARFRKTTGVPVEKENCGRVNAETLKKFDAVLFFTTGNPLNQDEIKDLVTWVKAGGAIAGTHCGSDTLYPAKDKPWNQAYGELIGAYFDGHPWHQKIKVKVEDPEHAAARGFKDGDAITDEIYQFRPEPYSRGKLHIILSVDNSSIDVKKGKRQDNDYAIAWCQEADKGRAFYTSLGHRKEVWTDKRFQDHLFGGLNWAVKRAPGSGTPSSKKTD
jgi:type 1 glutamine amidotransferase